MARGEPLDDADRWPWLDRLRAIIDGALAGGGALVLACSALKASYRARLAGGDAAGGCASSIWRERPSCCGRASPSAPDTS